MLPEADRRALLCDVSPLERFFPKRALRRMDRFSRLALLGACLCLEDAGLLQEKGKGGVQSGDKSMGLILATGYGAAATTFAFLDSCIDDGDALASPTHFSNSVHNAAAANVAIQLGMEGPALTVSQFGFSFASALATAALWLHEGRAATILLGGVDEACDVLAYCHGRLAPGQQDAAAVAGEGGAFFLLRKSQPANGSGYGALTGTRLFAEEPHGGNKLFGAWGRTACTQDASFEHAPLWGNTPAGQALDIAAACLQRQSGNHPPLHCLFHTEAGVSCIDLV